MLPLINVPHLRVEQDWINWTGCQYKVTGRGIMFMYSMVLSPYKTWLEYELLLLLTEDV